MTEIKCDPRFVIHTTANRKITVCIKVSTGVEDPSSVNEVEGRKKKEKKTLHLACAKSVLTNWRGK